MRDSTDSGFDDADPRPGAAQNGSEHVYNITEADESHTADVHSRMFKYTLTMGIRLACFIAAFFFLDSWLVWVFLAGAAFLPWVAVVIANGATKDHSRDPAPTSLIDHAPYEELGAEHPVDEPDDEPVTLEGELYTDEHPEPTPHPKTKEEGP
ncbi:DUF3099 domain-containing protein [Zhihengliuella salsuginis]|uniref:DUF3099 domain-containing protein n=1 Tax=Zhihengliuella salsuginis TaxID=578222 RepID=A0ABQ3GF18_9MICC|nr:DUF3099 domain-containing protein [Zhihengliuella salsuginis]GHD01594.1 hypothetical protein GCM10008096_05890 [Zhihengliuella salsuginis]